MIKSNVYRAVSRSLLQPWFRLRRGITLGVRAALIDRDNQVLLVRHTYAPGWLLPGGGVERGETIYEAAVREVREEAGIVVNGRLNLHGIFSNEADFPGDHIACFIIREFTREPWSPTIEIAEARFFPLAALPEATTGGTRRRLAEITDGTKIAAQW
jgi:8-oxo-dGTP pyrophosphatase MutT (NUDIX family)